MLTKGRIACRAVIENWMIPFAAYTAAETLEAFQWAGQPKNCPLPWGIWIPCKTWFFRPT